MLTKQVFSVVCVLVVLLSSSSVLVLSAEQQQDVVVELEDTRNTNTNGTNRDKRTIGVVLRNVADLFGYDVQKRPTAIPPSMAPAPAAPAPAAPAMMTRQRVPLLPPAPPLPVLPPPVTFPPILQEQVRKTFNINFNWNKAVGAAQPVGQPGGGAAQPAAQPAKPAAPAAPAAPQPVGPISSGPKRPVTKTQLYTEYQVLYPPLGTAPPAPKYVKYNYKYGPINTVSNYNNDQVEPSQDVPSNEKESSEVLHEDNNYDDYENNSFLAADDGEGGSSPEAGRKEQYKNNVRNFWANNRWALQDSGYKYIAPETQQQQQNFQQDYPKEILAVKESNYYKPLQPLKKVKFQDYYVTQAAAQPLKKPAPPLPTQDISQFKKYYVQPATVAKLAATPTQSPETQNTDGDGKTISPQDLKKIVHQLVKLTQQDKQNTKPSQPPTPATAPPISQEVLSKYEEYTLPPTKDYYPTSTELTFINPYNPRQKKVEKEKALINKKEFNNHYKEEKHEPTYVEHDYNILNTVTGNEIPYDEHKFEEFKQKHGYHSPVEVDIPLPDSDEYGGSTKEDIEDDNKSNQEEEEGNKEPIDDDYVANIRKPSQNTLTEEHIETTPDEKAKVLNIKEPIYDAYNDYEEQNDAPVPLTANGNESPEEELDIDDDDEEKQNTAREEEDGEDEEEGESAPAQKKQKYYPTVAKTARKTKKANGQGYEEEVESRIKENIKKIISVDPKSVETDIVPKPTYQYFTFKNRKILGFNEPEETRKVSHTTVSPDYEDFSYKPGTTLALAEKAAATREKQRQEEQEEEEEEEKPKPRPRPRYQPPSFATERVPDYEEVKSSITKRKPKRRNNDRHRRREYYGESPEQAQRDEEVSPVTEAKEEVYTYAPPEPLLDKIARVVEETQKEMRTELPITMRPYKKRKDKGEKYVELSDFLKGYDDFDYLHNLNKGEKEKESSEEKEKEEEETESSKSRLTIVDNPTQSSEESRVREIRSKKPTEEKEETSTEPNKYFDNYQIFKDFFNTKTDSHEEDDDEDGEKREGESKKEALGYPGFSKAYDKFDYTRTPEFFAQPATDADNNKKEDNKEKKQSSSEHHDNYNYHPQTREKEETSEEEDKEKEPEEDRKKEKVDNPYSIPTEFDISHYTNPNIPEIPEFLLEEDRKREEEARQQAELARQQEEQARLDEIARQEQLQKYKEASGDLRPNIRKVKKPRKHPGGPRPGIPVAKIVPVNVADTNVNPRMVLPNAAFRPIGATLENNRNAAAGSENVETLYSGLQPNQLHELAKDDKTLPLTIPFDYDYSSSQIVQNAVPAAVQSRRRREIPSTEAEAFTYLPPSYDKDFSYTVPEPAVQPYEALEKKEHPDDETLSKKAKVYTSEEGKLKGHIRADEDSKSF